MARSPGAGRRFSRGQRIRRMDAFEGNSAPREEEIVKQLQLTNYGHGGPIYYAETDVCDGAGRAARRWLRGADRRPQP